MPIRLLAARHSFLIVAYAPPPSTNATRGLWDSNIFSHAFDRTIYLV